MNITESNRGQIEQQLVKAAATDARIAEACARHRAKLDGSDDLLVLCAVDDDLARILDPKEHPLAQYEGARSAWARMQALRGRPQKALGKAPPSRGVNVAELKACLAAATVDSKSRRSLQATAKELLRLPEVLAALCDVGDALVVFMDRCGRPELLAFPDPDWEPDSGNLEGILRTPTELEELQRQWLAAELAKAEGDTFLLRVRSKEASELCGFRPPWKVRGPASLHEAAVAWLRNFGSPQKLELEQAVGEEVLGEVVDNLINAAEQARVGAGEYEPPKKNAPKRKGRRRSIPPQEPVRQLEGALMALCQHAIGFDSGEGNLQLLRAVLLRGADTQAAKHAATMLRR